MIRSDILDEEAARNVSAQSLQITPPFERRSSAYLTKFEVARIVGERAKQIMNGAVLSMPSRSNSGKDFIETAERCSNPLSLAVDPVTIAKYDLLQRKIAMIVRRSWPDGTVENIPVSELLLDTAMLDLQY